MFVAPCSVVSLLDIKIRTYCLNDITAIVLYLFLPAFFSLSLCNLNRSVERFLVRLRSSHLSSLCLFSSSSSSSSSPRQRMNVQGNLRIDVQLIHIWHAIHSMPMNSYLTLVYVHVHWCNVKQNKTTARKVDDAWRLSCFISFPLKYSFVVEHWFKPVDTSFARSMLFRRFFKRRRACSSSDVNKREYMCCCLSRDTYTSVLVDSINNICSISM
jgi:hypothetical protein